jgi:hypothetical protein
LKKGRIMPSKKDIIADYRCGDKTSLQLPKVPKGWSILTRGSKLIEFVCPHGVGHPAPQQFQPARIVQQAYWSTHGCDGCCNHEIWGDTNKNPEEHPSSLSIKVGDKCTETMINETDQVVITITSKAGKIAVSITKHPGTNGSDLWGADK